MQKNIIQELATQIQARANCAQSGNVEWYGRWTRAIAHIEKNYLPSGSGIDRGTRVDFDKSTADRIVLVFEFHHMNENGMYDGWTEHTATITPGFNGIHIAIGGRNRNGIKDYLHGVLSHALHAPVTAEILEVLKESNAQADSKVGAK